jgi:hypothetical protein
MVVQVRVRFNRDGSLKGEPMVLNNNPNPAFRFTASSYVFRTVRDHVASVPEPSTWAMMLLGFAGLGFAFRRSSGVAIPRGASSLSSSRLLA